MAGATCLKCGAVRNPGDEECPFCGVIYAKAEAAAKAKAQQQTAEEQASSEKKTEKSANKTGCGCALAVLLAVLLFSFFNGDKNDERPTILPGNTFIVKPNTFGCINLDDYKHVTNIGRSGDTEAFKKLLKTSILTGKCNYLQTGSTAYIEDTSFMEDAVKVRMQGETTSYWIPRKTIEK